MQINLTEVEIKQAITDYLSQKLVEKISSTDITMTAGRAPAGTTAAVDIVFVAYKEKQRNPDKIPPVGATKSEPDPIMEPAPVKEYIEKVKTEAKVVKTSKPPVKVVEAAKETPPVIEPKVEDAATELDPFGAIVEGEKEEAPIVEGENVMTENFELASEAPKVAAPIVDDVEDLFNC
jgi:hypothetical protein